MASNAQHRFSPMTTDNHAGSIWIATILCLVYSFIVLLTRAWLRKGMYGVDDFCLLGAVAMHFAQSISVVLGLRAGLGQTLTLLSQTKLREASQAAFAADILYVAAVALAKCSTLYLMLRLFNLNGTQTRNDAPRKVYHWSCKGLLTAVVIFGVGSVLAVSVDCSAPDLIRSPPVSSCPRQLLRWQIIAALDITTEAALMLMALLIVIPVQLRPHLKLQIILAFLFRLPLIALSALRTHYVRQHTHAPNPGTSQDIPLVIQQVYLAWTVMSATIPNLKAFVRSFGSGFGIGIDMSTYAHTTKTTTTSGGGPSASGSKRREYELGSVQGRPAPSQPLEEHGLHDHTSRPSRRGSDSVASEGSQHQIIRKDGR